MRIKSVVDDELEYLDVKIKPEENVRKEFENLFLRE